MKLIKYIGCLAIAALASFMPLKKAEAQTLDWYSNTKSESGIEQSENNVIGIYCHAAAGCNFILKEDQKPQNVFASKIDLNNGNSKVYFTSKHNEEDSLEAKLNQKVFDGTDIDIGIGSDCLFHTGLEHGFLRPFGFGLSYVGNDEKNEIRGELWRYWDNLLFTGIRKSNERYNTVISLPRAGQFSIRYLNINDFEDFQLNQLLIGESREGNYGLHYKDSCFLLRDQQIIGSESVISDIKPFGFIAPPIAWRVKNYGVGISHTENKGKTSVNGEAVKYLNETFWAGCSYSSANNITRIGPTLGYVSGKVNLAFGLNLDSNNELGGSVILRVW